MNIDLLRIIAGVTLYVVVFGTWYLSIQKLAKDKDTWMTVLFWATFLVPFVLYTILM